MGWGPLVISLIGMHVAAFLAWLVLLVCSSKQKSKGAHQD